MSHQNISIRDFLIRDGRTMQKNTCSACHCWSLAKKSDTDEEPVCVNRRCETSPWYGR
ncbi:hypothetical protein [Streptomyces pini]|uniref:Uncharacterized protein n=1 Tax=Streptomyces pini TaxID=1520580 RepID=A0A1I4C0N7_9ACTN|nr:hypothetical protein [Streptomyces pini]SFK74190.1 hypothetical protein SAMN05192584_108199 [Streptomyces pini]